jgi:PqqD family protein of HPr-rel-A system
VNVDQRPVPRPDVSAYTLDEELVVYDPRSAETYLLNPTAAYVWEACDGENTIEEIARGLSEGYAIDVERALDDVREIIQGFQRAGLIAL